MLASLMLMAQEEYLKEELMLPGSSIHKTPPKKVTAFAKYMGKGAWKVLLHFPKAVELQHIEKDERFFYAAFNQAVDSKDLLLVQEKLSFLILRFSNGFNTLYIEAKRAVFYHAQAFDNSFLLDIVPNYLFVMHATKSVKLARARILVEQRCYAQALRALYRLALEYPCDRDILVLLASLEGLLPRWQYQMQILELLEKKYPSDEELKKLVCEAFTPHSSYVKPMRQLQRTIGLAAMQIYQLEGEEIIQYTQDHVLYLKQQVITERGHMEGVVNNQGAIVGVRATRSQVNASLRKEWACGSKMSGSLFGAEQVVGIEGKGTILFPIIQGDVTLTCDLHKPYWATFEAFTHFGREDLIGLDLNGVYSRDIAWSFGVATHRVGIEGVSNGFSSVLLTGQLFWELYRLNPIISLNYGLDAEYLYSQKTLIGASGQPYNPMPYSSFENHSFRLYYVYTWRERFYLTLFGGETFNRIGINNPTYGINLKYMKPCPCGFEVELSAYSFPSTIVQGATSQYVTASFTMRF